jgi:hypothetical protein
MAKGGLRHIKEYCDVMGPTVIRGPHLNAKVRGTGALNGEPFLAERVRKENAASLRVIVNPFLSGIE